MYSKYFASKFQKKVINLDYNLKEQARAGFLNLNITDILGWIIRCCGLLSCRLFSSIPGL